MSESTASPKVPHLIEEVINFVAEASGLKVAPPLDGVLKITQIVDGKCVFFRMNDVNEVVRRFDTEGKLFLQVNFTSNLKVLLTETLVGFKPEQIPSLDMTKLPKVVTTPDLVSVLEAIEDTLSSDMQEEPELEVLKKVYQAILLGGESAGFELTFERKWLSRLGPSRFRASA